MLYSINNCFILYIVQKNIWRKKVKIKHLAFTAGIMCIFLLASCGSTPAPEPVVEPEVNQEAETPVVEQPAETEDLTQVNTDLLQKVEQARALAIEAKADSFFPDVYVVLEEKYQSLKDLFAQDSKVDYSAEANDLISRYNAIAKAAQAKLLKGRIDELGFADFDPKAYEDGQAALDKYSSQEGEASALLSYSDAALNAYKDIINKGFVALAGRERNAALEAKKNADSVKAGVAKKEEYSKASEIFKKADSAYVTKDIEGAYEGYRTSKESYTKLFEVVSRNRAQAQAALERAKQKVQEAEEFTLDADTKAPLESQITGIEDENTVLLESDDLANPDEAVIDVESSDTAKKAEEEAATAIAEEEAENALQQSEAAPEVQEVK